MLDREVTHEPNVLWCWVALINALRFWMEMQRRVSLTCGLGPGALTSYFS
jgi:hypothetical protein